jgi:hypothetical protein
MLEVRMRTVFSIGFAVAIGVLLPRSAAAQALFPPPPAGQSSQPDTTLLRKEIKSD